LKILGFIRRKFDDDVVADVVVIPSIGEFTEAFSIVLSEAWARGKTVVVSESRALRSRVKGHGYIFSGYDAGNLAEAVKEEKRKMVVKMMDEYRKTRTKTL